jgi:hypothetical protein
MTGYSFQKHFELGQIPSAMPQPLDVSVPSHFRAIEMAPNL